MVQESIVCLRNQVRVYEFFDIVMTVYVLGVGLGLFIIIAIWISAIVLCIVSSRTQKNIGFIIIILATIVTTILISIPRESESSSPPVQKLYDRLFIWRILLVIFLGLSAVAGGVVVCITHFIEPRNADPLKQWN